MTGSTRTQRRVLRALAALAVTASAITVGACSNGVESGGGPDQDELKIGLLLPDSVTARYRSADRPYFEAKIAELAPDATVLYGNADGDAAKQQLQAESMLTQGVSVLVLSPYDSAAAATIVAEAKAKGVPVVDYDRTIDSADLAYYVSFDNVEIGRLQARALVERLGAATPGAAPGILVVNGSPTDNNAGFYKQGAHEVLDASAVRVLAEYDTPGWDPTQAQNWVSGQITRFGDTIDGVYVANDSMAAGVISAFKAAGIETIPPVTGQDAELAGLQRILSGDQYMTVYKAMRPQAERAAEVALQLANGEMPVGDTEIDGVPSTILPVVAVTVDDIADTVIADGAFTVAEICTAAYVDDCREHGLRPEGDR